MNECYASFGPSSRWFPLKCGAKVQLFSELCKFLGNFLVVLHPKFIKYLR